jgi:uncharacterized membrane protein (UPF0182 family)
MPFSEPGVGHGDRVSRDGRRRGIRLAAAAVVVGLVLGAGSLLSWYIDALWFDSLGYSEVFWKTLELKSALFCGFALATFVVLYAALRLLQPPALPSRVLYVNGQPVPLSLQPLVRILTWVVALVVSLGAGSGMMAEWTTFVQYLHRPAADPAALVDPVFGRPVVFYLFTLPVWQLMATWLTTIAVVVFAAAVLVLLAGGADGGSVPASFRSRRPSSRAVSCSAALLLLVMALRVWLSRFDFLFDDHTIFSGAGYTEAHILVPGLALVAAALVLGAIAALYNAAGPRRLVVLAGALAPAAVVYLGLTVVSWYVSGFVVKPNQLVRERPYIARNIEFTNRAFGLAEIDQKAFPAESGLPAVDFAHNAATVENIRLWDWRALQDTLRQIQEIRTYYDFPDIDIDRYRIGGRVRQVMVAARELNVDKLPESSRNFINEKLIYTHGYGVTMNPVNGFTADGLPDLILKDMPVQSAAPEVTVTRPEIYYGQLTSTDVYVNTRQKEFNYPQGESNSYTTYEGKGGIPIGSFGRRLLLAASRGGADLSKLPFSDDITPGSRLLMRRNIRERVRLLAPFLTFDPDPYIVVSRAGRLYWMMDGYTMSDMFPYARHYRVGDAAVNYVRNSVKVVVDAYDGTVTFYAFDAADPIIACFRGMFPSLFADASRMPADLRAHVRYPELMIKVQAAAYSLYHMRDPEVFYNREDLWSVASEMTLSEDREQVSRPLEPNYVLMTLPGEQTATGEQALEFVEILPFTPSNRNNLIGWIAGRSDGAEYGKTVVYDFPKTRLVDGPLQVEARIDQNPQLSAQLTLWNQQGSHVRRGSMIVIPVGRGLLFAKPVYLQAERSPMPQLRLVVLALQDQLGYGPTFDEAMSSLAGVAGGTTGPAGAGAASTSAGGAGQAEPAGGPLAGPTGPAGLTLPPGTVVSPAVQALIDQAARDLADYQRLTAEGKLGEAGQRLESLKKTLDRLRKER